MKLIDVQPTVELDRDAAGNAISKKMSFFDWLDLLIEGSKELGQGLKNIRRSHKLFDRVDKARKENAAVLKLEDADYETLKKTAEDMNWNVRIAAKIIGFLEALCEKAQDEKGPAGA